MTQASEADTDTAMPSSTPKSSVPSKAANHKSRSLECVLYRNLASSMSNRFTTELMTMAASVHLGRK